MIVIAFMILVTLWIIGVIVGDIWASLENLRHLITAIYHDNKEETVVYRPWEDPCAKDRKIWVKSRNTPPDYRDPYDE